MRNDPIGYKAGQKYREIGVVGYVDNSYAGDIKDKNLISKYCFFLSESVIT